MRLPQRPPVPLDVFAQRGREVQTALSHPETQEFVRRCEMGYLHWDEVRYRAPGQVDAQLAWAMVKLGRMQRYRTTRLTGSDAKAIRYIVPDPVQHELMLIDQQLAGHLVADDGRPLAARDRERYIVNALREEAIASSMLEGAATTRRDAKAMLRSGRKPRTRGEQMVANNYRAIEFIRENRRADLTPEMLLEVQSILTEHTLDRDDEVGRFRTAADDVTVVDQRDHQIIHTPPPADELPARLRRLCDFANTDRHNEFIHPVVRAGILHFQIGFDHPFCDGNGRTARAMFYWLMLRHGYWLFEFLPISRLIYASPVKYTRAYLYTETDDFDATYFLMYKARIIGLARKELREYLTRKQAEVTEAREVFDADSRLNHRQRAVLLRAARDDAATLTLAGHKAEHHVAYATARSDLLDLVSWGYLQQRQVGKRFEFVPDPKWKRKIAGKA